MTLQEQVQRALRNVVNLKKTNFDFSLSIQNNNSCLHTKSYYQCKHTRKNTDSLSIKWVQQSLSNNNNNTKY